MQSVKQSIEGPDGFHVGLKLQSDELVIVRNLIESQWLKAIQEADIGKARLFEARGISRYHELAHLLDHSKMWPKSKRILPSEAVKIFRKTSLIESLSSEFGSFEISGEEGIEKEEVYWRLVRPDCLSDVGPLHADEWFWALGHGKTPVGHKRVKVWISIFAEKGKSGFKFVRGSHKKSWRYHGVKKDGFIKPQIDEDEERLGAELFMAEPGNVIVFHDCLLHGGLPGDNMTRVSLEFTMFVKI